METEAKNILTILYEKYDDDKIREILYTAMKLVDVKIKENIEKKINEIEVKTREKINNIITLLTELNNDKNTTSVDQEKTAVVIGENEIVVNEISKEEENEKQVKSEVDDIMNF